MKRAGPVIHHRSFYTNFVLMEPYFIYMRANLQCYMCVKEVYCHFPYDYTWNNALSSTLSYLCNHQFSSDNGLAMRRNISNVGTLRDRRAAVWAPRRSIAFRNSACTWSRAPGKQFGVLDRWRDRHTRPARWSDTLRIRPVRWLKWNRIRIDLARLADPIGRLASPPSRSEKSDKRCRRIGVWVSTCLWLPPMSTKPHCAHRDSEQTPHTLQTYQLQLCCNWYITPAKYILIMTSDISLNFFTIWWHCHCALFLF